MSRHHLYVDSEHGFSETTEPVVYLDAYRGWVREIPGTLGKDSSGLGYVTISIRTGYRVDR